MDNLTTTLMTEKIIVIVRGTYGDDLIDLANALYAGGIRLLEITFAQDDPDRLTRTGTAIAALIAAVPGDMAIGAGTVLSTAEVDAAQNAGARFIISPNTDQEVITYTKQQGLLSIPGAMTPSEIASAHKAGADFIKVFPADHLGAAYIRSVRAPLSQVKLLATSGITEQNIREFLDAGYVGAGISGCLTDKALIREKNWAEFTRRAAVFCQIAKSEA